MFSNRSDFINLDNFIKEGQIKEDPDISSYKIIDKTTNCKYIANIFQKDINEYTKEKLSKFSNDFSFSSKFNHPSILKYVGYSPVDFKKNPRPVIITDDNENLYRIIDSRSIDFDSPEYNIKKYIIIYGIASAMSYLHLHDIIHCDLSTQNIYLDENCYPKLTGFHYSQFLSDKPSTTSIDRFSKYKGNLEYFSPEIFKFKNYSKASDVYAFSIIIYEIFRGSKPFNYDTFFKHLKEIVFDNQILTNEFLFDDIPSYYSGLIQKCMSDDPSERPTFDEIVKILKADINLINNEEYQKYVKFIDESLISFDHTQEFHLFDDIIKSSINKVDDFQSRKKKFELENFIDDTIKKNIFGIFNEIHNRKTNEQYLARCSEFPFELFSENDITNLTEELSVISQLNHPSIVKFIGYNSTGFESEPGPTIITEFYHCKTLNFFFKKGKVLQIWDETHKLIFIYGIASAMSYLHAHNILHRDLKPKNIFIDELFFPKITGFHLCKELPSDTDYVICKEIKGTPIYLSPEVYKNKKYSKANDVYAFAYVVYEIMTSKKPFEDLVNVSQIYKEVVQNKRRPEFNENIPESFKKLIEKCWSDDPRERPTFDEIVGTLRTDLGFITDAVNSEDYHKYIKMIDESNIVFTPETKLKYEDITEIKIEDFHKNESIQTFRFSILGVYETEMNNISLDFKYLDLKNFEELDTIGKGSFSVVTKIRDKITGNEYAAKYMTKPKKFSKKEYIILSKQVNFVTQLNHPTIVKSIGFSPVDFKNQPHPVLVTELSNNQEIPEWDDTKKLINIYGLASSLAYLHSKGILYHDLKPANILLDEYLFPKLFDFDCSSEISTLAFDDRNFGTPVYIAPEILDDQIADKPIDVYSYAIVVYEIMTNLIPFPNVMQAFQIYKKVKNNERPEIPDKVPKCYRELIEKCWAHDPKDRPTFDEIVNMLRTDKRFITDYVEEEEFRNYIKYIDEPQTGLENHPDQAKTASFTKIDLSSYLHQRIETKTINSDAKTVRLYSYIKQKTLGSGSFGTVYKVYDEKEKKIYAAKVAKTYLTQCNDDDVKNLEREINIISKLKHPAILKFIGYNISDFKGKPKPIIITEFIPNGSLQDILELDRKGCRSRWDDTKKLICIYGIASGMSYLHHIDILHRDLKPANILLDEYLFPKISDFGLSKNIDESNNLLSSGYKGTYAYSAPEVFENEYSKPGDVYAFAIIVYEIMTGENPYHNIYPYQLLAQVPKGLRPEFKIDIPICYRKLIEACWDNNPLERPTFDEIVELLKTDPDFITELVDEAEFLDYVDFIDESNNESELKYQDPILQNSIVEVLDLNKYESSDQIDDRIIFDNFKIISKKTKDKYMASIMKSKIKKMSLQLINELLQGLSIFQQLNHPLFLKLIGYSPVDFKSKQHPVVVSELGSIKSLKKIIGKKEEEEEEEKEEEEKHELNDTEKLIIIFGIAFGMRYLHSEDVIHRILSTNSIFLDEYFHPKISDLELLKKVSEDSAKEEELFLEIYSYSAPEIFHKKYSKSSDVYAFAMITYEILTEESVYDNVPIFQIQYDTLNGKRPELTSEIPKCYRKLIEECWSEEASKRPSFNEIVERLKTDEFKSENIEVNKFIQYVDSLEEFERNNESHIMHKEIKLTEKREESTEKELNEKETKSNETSESKFKKVSIDFDQNKEILKEEQPLDTEFLDMDKFKLGNIISKQDYSKTYEIISKETGEIYSAKISTVRMNEFSRDELISLSREVNNISQLNHPSFLKFIGYSPIDTKKKRHPVIVTELAANGTLRQILDCEREKTHIPQWNETTKLINIYGIASGMMYLHSHNILHRDLTPMNIYLDEYLFPKIGDFGLSTKNHTTDTMTYQSTAGLRGNPAYSSPEVLRFNDYSKSSDVYSFGFIAYEILCGEIPFNGIVNKNAIFNEVVNNENRPEIPENLPNCYRNLIEKCWAQERTERPTFEEIVENIKSDSNFITEKIKKEDYFNYIEFIDESRKSFDSKKKILDLSEFIQSKSKINEEEGSDINKNRIEENFKSDQSDSESVEGKINEEASENNINEETSERKINEKVSERNINEKVNERKINEETSERKINEKVNERKINEETSESKVNEETSERKIEEDETRNDLNGNKTEVIDKSNEILIDQKAIQNQEDKINEEVQKDPYTKEIEEEPMNEIKADLRNVLERAINKMEENSLSINPSHQENNDDVVSIKKLAMKYSIENDTENTYLYMKKLIDLGEFEVPMEYGICLYKQGKFEISMKYFKLLSKFNHPIANFFIGIMKYRGEGCKVDRTESYSILKHLSDNGIEKATEFIEHNFHS